METLNSPNATYWDPKMEQLSNLLVEQTFNNMAVKIVTEHIARLDALALEIAEQKKHIESLIASFN
jgi:hypothetical protein